MGAQGETASHSTAEPANERLTERDAVLASRAGDRNAFGRLVTLHQNRLFSLALMMLKDAAMAEDITQEAFVRAFLHLDRYDEQRPFYPWLAAITVRLAQSWLRRPAHKIERDGADLEAANAPAPDVDPLDVLITDEQSRELWGAVAALPQAQRTAVFLYYRQDMKLKDVATALGITSGTIKTLLFRARRTLRGQIDPLRSDAAKESGDSK